MLAVGLFLALLSAAALSCGFYLQHSASSTRAPLALRHPLASLSALFSNGRWLLGFSMGLSGWALYITALRLAPLSLVQATSAGGIGLLALMVWLRGGTLSRADRLAVAVSVGALVLLGLSVSAGAPRAARPGWPAPLTWVLASMLLAGLAAAPPAGVLRPGAGLAAAAGLLYSAGDVATKAAVDGIPPVALFAVLLPLCHGLAFVCLQLAFQRGTPLATAGLSTVLTNVLPILAGVTIFAEYVPARAPGLLRGLGFAGAILAATLLAIGRQADREASQRDPSTMSQDTAASHRRGAEDHRPGWFS